MLIRPLLVWMSKSAPSLAFASTCINAYIMILSLIVQFINKIHVIRYLLLQNTFIHGIHYSE